MSTPGRGISPPLAHFVLHCVGIGFDEAFGGREAERLLRALAGGDELGKRFIGSERNKRVSFVVRVSDEERFLYGFGFRDNNGRARRHDSSNNRRVGIRETKQAPLQRVPVLVISNPVGPLEIASIDKRLNLGARHNGRVVVRAIDDIQRGLHLAGQFDGVVAVGNGGCFGDVDVVRFGIHCLDSFCVV